VKTPGIKNPYSWVLLGHITLDYLMLWEQERMYNSQKTISVEYSKNHNWYFLSAQSIDSNFVLVVLDTIYIPDNNKIQWKQSARNLLKVIFCVWNRQVFGLYRLNYQIFLKFGLHFKIWFLQDSFLFRVWFRQAFTVSLYFIVITVTRLWCVLFVLCTIW
jgi:hypothetical protein